LIAAMPAAPFAARELTRHLIARARAPGNDPADSAAAAHAACECVSTEFSRWVGVRGYEALLSRALVETRIAHPALESIRYEIRAVPAVNGMTESLARHGIDATTEALAALLESILALLARLIGDDIVIMLVEKCMENCAYDRLHDGRHIDQGSTAQ
jgi:hypothetical protein